MKIENPPESYITNLKSIPAFDDWLWMINKNDRLPRGQYFKARQYAKELLMPSKNQVFEVFDLRTVRAFTPPITISQRRDDFYEGNMLKVLDSQSGKKHD
ncbi:hypothetical protein YpsIP31758_A0014 (plasmid) [Yersinia pseudotuberculosis IP 31758]|uniref:Uncharacterized protein n=1 Tax=Yersinia pseudotuberculosis serotype O:1b (strain IP 31758) TaxID=349747 RepID=A0A0U1QT63_YERP3|nr:MULTISPECIES: hypothetical protein [Yersinia pseudotuberculosis complex]ABS45572.1 hypothetical protein YpsIP31758_A0014 [Yersinia pseudotuberculosis IP 31758]